MDKNKYSFQSADDEENDKFIQMEMRDLSNQRKDFDLNENNINEYLNKNIKNNDSNLKLWDIDNGTCISQIVQKKIYFLRNIKEKIKKNKRNEIIAFILSISAIFFYIISLKGCYGDEVHCKSILGLGYYLKIIILTAISGICTCLFLVLLTFGKVSSFHLYYLIPCFFILFLWDNGTSFAHHGYLNFVEYVAILLIFYPILCFIFLMIKLIRNKKYYIYIPLLFSLIFIFVLYIKQSSKCSDWEFGLNNTKIYNNEKEYACQIDFPKSCYLNIFDGVFNMTKRLNLECNQRDDKEKRMLFEYIKKYNNPYIKNPNAKKIGYPNLNKGDFPENQCNGLPKLSREVVYNLVDMDDLPPHITSDKIPETYVDFTDYPGDPDSKYGKLHFNIKKNETLVNERNKNSENNNVIFNNIITIFIDTVSRAHFNRKFPKLKKWLEKYMKYNSEDFINYQFLKFHSLGIHTVNNLKPLIYGESLLSPNGINILSYMKEKGYITGQADNYCQTQPYPIRPEFYNLNITRELFDHELISLFCEPNFYRADNPLPLLKGNAAVLRRCLYGYDTFHYLFSYSKLFWRTYSDNRKYLRLATMDSHESSYELIGLFDQPLVEFLDDLIKNGDLKDTALFIFSDHGNHMSPHLKYMHSKDFEIERIMPFSFLLVPKKNNKYKNENFLDEFYDNLYKNQQSLSTCYDIHDTMIHIIFNEGDKTKAPYSKNGTSFFNRINDKFRTCEDFSEIYGFRPPEDEHELPCNCINNKI